MNMETRHATEGVKRSQVVGIWKHRSR
ncbi:hypothetical protein E2C01_084733 [Portunus trituberculatus]|uniref:Uncharacterized protein n=1 Tax=Portunus trituberculatus TaxID=210409 RepID=A0A5B7J5L4_PORTR|nr:hypothetical protein [Portunus trituberculatus]